MSEKQEQLNNLIEELVSLGESKEEFEFWRSFFENLNESEKDEILSLLKKEKEKLESSK